MTTDPYDRLIRLVRAARGLEAGGFYNAAKLLWAMAYSQEVQEASRRGVPRGEELDAELGEIIASMRADGLGEPFVAALEKGREDVRADTTIPYHHIPAIYVSRTTGEIFMGQPPEFTDNGDHWRGLREFPPIWYFDQMTPTQVLEALAEGPDIVQKGVQGLSGDQLLIQPAPNEWNMRDLLWHLYQAHELLAGRVERMLTADNPPLVGLAMWSDKSSGSAGDILEHYRDSRERLLVRLKGIQPADWWRPGVHNEFGAQTILSQTTYFARHESSHMPQLTQIRRAALGEQ